MGPSRSLRCVGEQVPVPVSGAEHAESPFAVKRKFCIRQKTNQLPLRGISRFSVIIDNVKLEKGRIPSRTESHSLTTDHYSGSPIGVEQNLER